MSEKTLRINIVIDQDGEARRALDEVEGSLKKVEGSAAGVRQPLDRTSGSLKTVADRSDEVTAGVRAATAQFGLGTPIIAGYSAGMIGAAAAAAGLVVAAGAVGFVVRESISTYLEQSQVLDVNKAATDRLSRSWDGVKFAIGEAILGTEGDFTNWVDVINVGLVSIGAEIATDIRLAKELVMSLPGVGAGLSMLDAMDRRGGQDTRRRDVGGNLTDFGKQRLSEFIVDGLDDEVVAREQARLELSRYNVELDLTNAKTDAVLRTAKAYTQSQRELAEELFRVQDAARQAFDVEVANAFMDNLAGVRTVTEGIRDDFAALVLSGDQLKEFRIVENFDRAIDAIDERAENAGQLIAQLEAQRQAQLLILRQESEGMSDALAQDILIFREKYADVLHGLPETFQGIVPEVTSASGQIRDTLVDDLGDVETTAGRVFESIAVQARSAAQLLQEAAMHEFDAERNQQRGDPLGIGWLQRQQAADKRRLAGQAGFRESALGFAEGGVVPGVSYFGTGGFIPRGTDTVPAMLTPGEGVISRRGMAALDRMNSGALAPVININAPLVDARGAQLQDDDALARLSDQVARKMQEIAGRVG